MNLEPRHIAYRKVIGKLDGDNIVELATHGGLVMVALAKRRPEILGAGSHRAIARLIAQKKRPEIEYTELTKGDHVPDKYIEDLLPRWEIITDEMRARQGF